MTENNFQTAVRYGTIVLGICVILNIWVVMRHVEVYRDAARAENNAQSMMLRVQIFQSVIQDFSARAESDPHIAEILRKRRAASPPNPTPMNPRSPTAVNP